MAKYELEQYQIGKTTPKNGYERVWIEIETKNREGNKKTWKKVLCPDERYEDANLIEGLLRKGLEKAHRTSQKIGISEYKERDYILIELPDPEKPDDSKETVNHQLTVKST